MKYGFHYQEKVYAGIVAEKDSGEPFGALHNKQGYDYYSFYLLLHDIGILKTGIVGNYRLNFGQGLVLGQGSMFGKTAYSSSFTFRSTGIRRHTSTDEYNYFRGSGIALKWKQWTLSVFYSHRSLDGVIKGGEITSIYKTGLHRSEKEADKMNQLTMQMSGGNISYTGNSYQLGITGVYYCFNRSYEPELKDYSKYNLHGRSFIIWVWIINIVSSFFYTRRSSFGDQWYGFYESGALFSFTRYPVDVGSPLLFP